MARRRSRAERRYSRHVHGMRRIREDRAQHGADRSCPCFSNDDRRTFSRFADYPQVCSCVGCGNPRKHFGDITAQERRAPDIRDWA